MNGKEKISKEKGIKEISSAFPIIQETNDQTQINCLAATHMSMSGPTFTVNWRSGEVIPISNP